MQREKDEINHESRHNINSRSISPSRESGTKSKQYCSNNK